MKLIAALKLQDQSYNLGFEDAKERWAEWEEDEARAAGPDDDGPEDWADDEP